MDPRRSRKRQIKSYYNPLNWQILRLRLRLRNSAKYIKTGRKKRLIYILESRSVGRERWKWGKQQWQRTTYSYMEAYYQMMCHRFSIKGRVYPAILPVQNRHESSDKLQAHAYVWRNTSDPNLYGDWDFVEWKQVHKESFIKMTMGFMEELELPESKPIGATYESFYQQDDAEK
ncbi:hypothetical protein GOBAR_DD27635 [Gossypium barbadense]|nr:hypothetical protein GOBAR_DD27635 [Gossypium barbadense]